MRRLPVIQILDQLAVAAVTLTTVIMWRRGRPAGLETAADQRSDTADHRPVITQRPSSCHLRPGAENAGHHMSSWAPQVVCTCPAAVQPLVLTLSNPLQQIRGHQSVNGTSMPSNEVLVLPDMATSAQSWQDTHTTHQEQRLVNSPGRCCIHLAVSSATGCRGRVYYVAHDRHVQCT